MFKIASSRPLAQISSKLLFKAPVPLHLQRLYATKKYTPEHEWIQVGDDGVGTVGITDYAQAALGDVVYVEVPAPGKKVSKSDSIGAVESVKAASDIYAPVSGEILEGNSSLDTEPSLINTSPEQNGWLAKIKLSNKSEVDQLMDLTAYKAHCEKQAH